MCLLKRAGLFASYLIMKMQADASQECARDGAAARAAVPCCEECGRPDAERIGDHLLCMDCYTLRGSCCQEFGREEEEA
jgi:hypothetical protein